MEKGGAGDAGRCCHTRAGEKHRRNFRGLEKGFLLECLRGYKKFFE